MTDNKSYNTHEKPKNPAKTSNTEEAVYRFPALQVTNDTFFDVYESVGILTPDECKEIVSFSRSTTRRFSGKIWGPDSAYSRKTNIFWLYPNEDNMWIFRKLSGAVSYANNNAFNFDLYGHFRALQLGEYQEGFGYDWHLDLGSKSTSTRKLTVCIQLSDEKDYSGGELEFFRCGAKHKMFTKQQGAAAVFPPWMIHRVSRVKSGVRWSLVTWVEGPPFR